MVIEVHTAADAAEWDRYVDSHQEGTAYHIWRWRRVFELGLGHDCTYLIARAGERVVGVLPLVHVRSWLFGRVLSSLPYVNYGGVLADSTDVAEALVERAAELAAGSRLEHVVLRHRSRKLPKLPVREHKVTMMLGLEQDAERAWTVLDRKVRNQIRKAEKSGLTCVTGGVELLDGFYAVFARNMRDLGTPVYGKRLFEQILLCEPKDARLHIVYLDGQPIAGALTIEYRDTLEVPSASSLREHRALCPNHLMYWSMIQHAIAARRAKFDFGRSTPGDGTFAFKEQWGAVPEQLFWEYRLLNGASLPADDRQSDRYQRRIEAWKKLPLSVTLSLGPRIARCVP